MKKKISSLNINSLKIISLKNIKTQDERMFQPIVYKERDKKGYFVLQQSERFKIKNKHITFFSPNTISLYVRISKKELILAKKLFIKLISSNLSTSETLIFERKNLNQLYDYFEHLLTSIMFSYTDVKAFCNSSIPNNFQTEVINNKGIKETWNKDNIERWLDTTKKLLNILPQTLDMKGPKDLKFWDDFKKLEDMRNEIIHLKTQRNKNKIEMSFYRKYFQKNIFRVIESGYKIIKHYAKNKKATFFIPFELGGKTLPINEVDKFENYFDLKTNKI